MLKSLLPGGAGDSLFDRVAWRYFRGFFAGRWFSLAVLSLAATLLSLLVIPTLVLVKRAFDVAIPAGDVPLLAAFGAGILAIRLVSAGSSLLLRKAHLKVIKAVIVRIRESLLRKLYTLSRETYTEMDREKVHAQIVQDTQRVSDMTNTLLATVIPSVLTGVVLLAVLIALNAELVLILLALLPLLAIASVVSARRVKKSVSRFHRAFEQFSKGLLFVLHHLELTQIQSSQAREIARQSDHLGNLAEANADMAYRFAFHIQIQNTLASAGVVLILVVGGAGVALGSITLGDFLAFYVAAGLLNSYFNALVQAVPQLVAGNESLNTLYRFSIADSKPAYTGTRQVAFQGTVTLQAASFSYGSKCVIDTIDLVIEPGCITAVVGPNGAGKSTIAHLVLGLYRPDTGAVYADDVPYDEIDVVQLRRQIGVVPQHPEFFAGSILENLTYGSDDVEPAILDRAARAAMLDSFIASLPDGYDTQVGSDGVLLSGGQCQRMAVARALLRRPRLLILDEPTNHLDTETVRELLHNISTLAADLSILLISHDPTVISAADRVYHLRHGALTEQQPLRQAN